MANIRCKECGCTCKRCLASDCDVQLHVEIENLKQHLLEKENHIVMMETNFLNEANKFPSGEIIALKDELLTWQDKYKRLYEAHRRVQRVNQGLEDKLLKLVDICETEKTTLTKDVAILSHKLAEANYAIKKLTDDNERYKNDVSLAIQFLQCKQTNFVAHRFDSLPSEVQTQVAAYMTNKRKPNEEKKIPLEPKSIKVPIPTFPPTAMVYSVPKSPKPDRRLDEDPEQPAVDIVSAAIMAKVLEERQKERALAKHCDTCTCAKNLKIIYDVSHHHVGTQTGDYKENVCLKCNELIKQPLLGIKILKPIEDKITRSSPYPNIVAPLPLETTPNLPNIVKVQPNNFLIEKTKSLSEQSERGISLTDGSPKFTSSFEENKEVLAGDIPKNLIFQVESEKGSKKVTETKDLIDFDDVTLSNVNENVSVHHQLCDQSSPSFEINQGQEKCDQEKCDQEKIVENSAVKIVNIAKATEKLAKTAENLRGPRYASMRVQTGSKNILLDNAHNNVAPVLYTRGHVGQPGHVGHPGHVHKNRHSPSQTQRLVELPQKHETPEKQETVSLAASYESKQISLVSENSAQHKQRINDWVQVTVENDNVSSPDNSRTEDLKSDPKKLEEKELEVKVDRVRYAEMEENVKRFLFGESEFLKTVEIGKLKYKSFREGEKTNLKGSREGSKTGSHTETEI